MCEFKSGIILKNKCYIVNHNSHSDMLKELNIKDDYLNATKTFVRAELIPRNYDWWTDIDSWEFIVDQDVVPEWFEIDKQKYEADFRHAVSEWCKIHILVDKEIDELKDGYFILKNCKVGKLLKDVVIDVCKDSLIASMHDESIIKNLCGKSKVNEMFDESQIKNVFDESKVCEMHNNSKIGNMQGHSQVMYMYDQSKISRLIAFSQVELMSNNSQITEMYDRSTVLSMCGNSKIDTMCDNSLIIAMYDDSKVVKMHGNAIARNYRKGKIFISPESKLNC